MLEVASRSDGVVASSVLSLKAEGVHTSTVEDSVDLSLIAGEGVCRDVEGDSGDLGK